MNDLTGSSTPKPPRLVKKRSPFEGMLRVVQFNWPLYAAASAAVLVLALLAAQPLFSGPLQFVLISIAFLVALQTLLSLLASHWVYDCSALSDWRFLREVSFGSGQQPGLRKMRIITVHSGYDESSGALHQIFANAEIDTIDLFSALGAREPSIIKARKLYPPITKSLCESISDWPVADASVDLILIAFAAHELRDQQKRELLFRQASQVLKSDGRIILVEHVRDLANYIAFGAGFMHFMPLPEWLRCASAANLSIAKQYRITPLVVVLELCR
ncbi:hypothetical protein BH11CYA1_BH11CYA1_13050 [soil metagenome]